MIRTHLTVDGGEQWLSWAQGRVRALRALDLPFLTKRYEMGDGSSVVVRITPWDNYIELRGTPSGGYAVTVQSDLYTPIEYSVINTIKEVDGNPKPPPYKRIDNIHRSQQPAYWVGGTSEQTRRVSHVDMTQNRYVVDNRPAQNWQFQDYLVRICYTNGIWVFIAARLDLSGYNIRAIDPATGQWVVIGSADVGLDGTFRSNDLGNVDVSPDGTKFMMTWSAEDKQLGFVKARYVREYAFIPPNPPAVLPTLSPPGSDKNIMPVVVDNRQDNSRGDITTTYTDRYGYGWDGSLRYISVETYERYDAGTGTDVSEGPFLPDFPGILAPGTYTSTDGARIVRNTLTVPGGATYTKSSTSSATNVYTNAIFWLGPVPIPWGPSSTGQYSITSEDLRLVYFDPRSGAFVTVESASTESYSGTTTADDYNSTPAGTWGRTSTFGDVKLKLHYPPLSKEWVLEPGATQTQGGVFVGLQGVHQYTRSPYPVMSKLNNWAPYLNVIFASRRPGEGVFSSYWTTFKAFAVIGQENNAPKFISDDTRGLKKHGEPGLVVTQIYPV